MVQTRRHNEGVGDALETETGSDAWEIVDYTSARGGYLQMTLNGVRVCDFFPFAKDADPAWVRAQAEHLRGLLNGGVAVERASCAEIARSMGAVRVAEAIEMGALMISTRST